MSTQVAPDIMVHISAYPTFPPYKEMKALVATKAGWRVAARIFDSAYNTYHGKTPEEHKWAKRVTKLLEKHCPEEYKKGAHLLFEQSGFMGEDLFVFEGNVLTTLHGKHTVCEKYQVLNWDRLYCGHCNKDIPEEEFSNA